MQRIVVGVDGSPPSLAALRWALDEAQIHHASVDAVIAWRVSGWFTLEGGGKGELERIAQELEADAEQTLGHAVRAELGNRKGLAVTQTVVEDRPAAALLERAQNADLLVVGSRGAGGFSGLVLGSVSMQCVHHAPCPVVVVRGG